MWMVEPNIQQCLKKITRSNCIKAGKEQKRRETIRCPSLCKSHQDMQNLNSIPLRRKKGHGNERKIKIQPKLLPLQTIMSGKLTCSPY